VKAGRGGSRGEKEGVEKHLENDWCCRLKSLKLEETECAAKRCC
jgi:hypothetical protein